MAETSTKVRKDAVASLMIEPCVNGYIVKLYDDKRVFSSEKALREWIGDLFLNSMKKVPGTSRIFNFEISSIIEKDPEAVKEEKDSNN